MYIFNSTPPTVMHIDINSCFATIEQQANPLLRGRPVVVAAYTTGRGCILTASVEAKRLGIKTGMRVKEGLALYPRLVVLPSDPDKYRYINHKMRDILASYTPYLSVESIDEMVMDLAHTPTLQSRMNKISGIGEHSGNQRVVESMKEIGKEIKQRIYTEIGEAMTVSIGIAPNRYLAKVASGLQKPDGLRVIYKDNIEDVLSGLTLVDLCGIKERMANRFRMMGILTPLAMYHATGEELWRGIHSIVGYQWYRRLHGYEDGVKYREFEEELEHAKKQKSFGQSYALRVAYAPSDPALHQIVAQLVSKMGLRLRRDGFRALGVGVSCLYTDHTYWQEGKKGKQELYTDWDLYDRIHALLLQAPSKDVRIVAVHVFDLVSDSYQQVLFLEDQKKEHVTQAIDSISHRWGSFTVVPGRMLGMNDRVLDRIAFGKAGISKLD